QIHCVPFCIVNAKVIGVMRMIDQGEADDKIIAVASDDVSVNYIETIEQLPPHFTKELRHFFEEYKTLEKKKVLVEDFQGNETAEQIIKQSFIDYKTLQAEK